jgi:hypothetical protein
MKKYLMILIASLICNFNIIAQDYNNNRERHRSNRSNTEVQDSNVTLLGILTSNPCTALFTENNYAYIGKGATLEILDISNPISPISVSYLILESVINQIYVADNYLFATDEDHILWIIDVTDKYHPMVMYSYDLGHHAFYNPIYVVSNYLYMGYEQPNGYFRIMDISDPSSLFEVSISDHIEFGVYDIIVKNGYAFVTNNYGKVYIFDVGNPSNPVQVSIYNTNTYNNRNIFLVDSLLYLGCNDANDFLLVLNITDPSNPTEVGIYYPDSGDYISGLCVVGDYSYLTFGSGKVSILDVSDPSNPTEVGIYELGITLNIYNNLTTVIDNHMYIPDELSMLHIIDVSDPENPIGAESYKTGAKFADIFVLGDYAYLTFSYDNQSAIVDIKDSFNPNVIGYIDNFSPTYVSGNYAYCAGKINSEFYVSINSITDPTNPFQVGAFTIPHELMSIFVVDNYAYLLIYGNTLKIIDISDPVNPVEAGYYQFDSWVYDISVLNNIAFITGAVGWGWWTSPDVCLYALDIGDPSNPILLETYVGDKGSGEGIFIQDNYAYLVCRFNDPFEGYYHYSWVDVIDISNPASLTKISYYYAGDDVHIGGIYIDQNYLYLACGWNNFKGYFPYGWLDVVRISNPSVPERAGYYYTPHYGTLSYSDGKVYLTDQIVGLYILQNDLITNIHYGSETPSTYFIYQNYPNPFNPSTKIRFSVPQRSSVLIKVFDILGNEIETLVNKEKPAGNYEITWNAANLPSGIYFYRLQVYPANGGAGSFVETNKMILLK